MLAFLQRRMEQTESEQMKERYEGFMRDIPCPECAGTRLKPEILAVTLSADNDAKSIAQVCDLSISDCSTFLNALTLGTREQAIAGQVLKEVQSRLGFLLDVGLDYLTLSRAAGTLSGGEAQRIRLATQIGSGLVGVLYVLDEPSIGLHQRDNRRLIDTLVRLRDLGNTLIVVEHDLDTIAHADWVVDIGPAAGEHGGQIVHSGTYKELLKNTKSLTGAYLSGREEIEVPAIRRPVDRITQGCKRFLGEMIASAFVRGNGFPFFNKDKTMLIASIAQQLDSDIAYFYEGPDYELRPRPRQSVGRVRGLNAPPRSMKRSTMPNFSPTSRAMRAVARVWSRVCGESGPQMKMCLPPPKRRSLPSAPFTSTTRRSRWMARRPR